MDIVDVLPQGQGLVAVVTLETVYMFPPVQVLGGGVTLESVDV